MSKELVAAIDKWLKANKYPSFSFQTAFAIPYSISGDFVAYAYSLSGSGTFESPLNTGAFFGELAGLLVADFQLAPAAAVPLPAALPLFATVIAGGGLIAWRRNRKAAKVATN